MIWLVATAMLFVTLFVLLLPLWRGQGPGTLDSNTANVAVLREQLRELELERDSGDLTQDQFEQASRDLQKSVAADLQEESTRPATLPGNNHRVVSLVLVVTLSLGSLLLYRQISSYQGTMAHQAQPVAQEDADGPPQTPSLDELVEILASRLRAEPDNVEGWKMLGKTYAILQRLPEAAAAFEQAYQRGGNREPDILADYAEVLSYGNNDQVQGRPMELLNEALEINPHYDKALWLRGFGFYQVEEYTLAVNDWMALLEKGSLDAESRAVLEQFLEEARSEAGLSPLPKTKPDVVATGNDTAVRIDVRVTLDDDLQSSVKPQDVVYVYAREVDGPPAPLAVRRITVAELPATITLDESMAMIAGHSLADKDRVLIGARISRKGTPVPQSGDIEGQSGILNPQQQDRVAIVINQVIQ